MLECLPGYWNPQDLVEEMAFASQLNQVYMNPKMSKGQKDQLFRTMQLAHTQEHSPGMVKRSKMQGFDQKYEAQHRLYQSDTIAHPNMISAEMLQPGGMLPQRAFKTTDQIMHERMAVRPFVPINRFDVASYVEYGRPKYDKHEDARMADGTVNKEIAKSLPTIGNKPVMERNGMRGKRRRQQMQMQMQAQGQMQSSNSNFTANGMGSSSNTMGSGYGQVSNGNAYNSVRNY